MKIIEVKKSDWLSYEIETRTTWALKDEVTDFSKTEFSDVVEKDLDHLYINFYELAIYVTTIDNIGSTLDGMNIDTVSEFDIALVFSDKAYAKEGKPIQYFGVIIRSGIIVIVGIFTKGESGEFLFVKGTKICPTLTTFPLIRMFYGAALHNIKIVVDKETESLL